MAPQFVDFDEDGHLDIFTATFDGSPHVARGSAEGFDSPSRLLDRAGERVLLTQFWNYETKEWDDTDRTLKTNEDGQLHCISAVAFDWDDDGDFDILLGDKNQGRLFRQMNEGSDSEPAFTGQNIPVLTDGKPFALAGGMTAPCLVDWDEDGLQDLVVGSFGDSYGTNTGGGIFLFRNRGRIGAPEFAAPVTLVEPSQKDAAEAARPDSGLYVDVVDYDQDGALDLLVGGYSHWSPDAQPLTEEQQKQAAELEAQVAEHLQKIQSIQARIVRETKDLDLETRTERMNAVYETEEYTETVQAYIKASQQLGELKPKNKREAFVWLYRNNTAASGG